MKALIAVVCLMSSMPAAAEIPSGAVPIQAFGSGAFVHVPPHPREIAKRDKLARAALPRVGELSSEFTSADCHAIIKADGVLYVCDLSGRPQQIVRVPASDLKSEGMAIVEAEDGLIVLDSAFATETTAEQSVRAASMRRLDLKEAFDQAVRQDRRKKREAAAAELLKRMEAALQR